VSITEAINRLRLLAEQSHDGRDYEAFEWAREALEKSHFAPVERIREAMERNERGAA
jgi:hypothetical protein